MDKGKDMEDLVNAVERIMDELKIIAIIGIKYSVEIDDKPIVEQLTLILKEF